MLTELALWGRALRGLRDNPLERLQRRVVAASFVARRMSMLFATFYLAIILMALFLLHLNIGGRWNQLLSKVNGIVLYDTLLGAALFGMLLSLLWLGFTLFITLRNSLTCLAGGRQFQQAASLEPSIVLSGLSSRELLLPSLSANLRLLVAPVLLVNFNMALVAYLRIWLNYMLTLGWEYNSSYGEMLVDAPWYSIEGLVVYFYWVFGHALHGLLAVFSLLLVAVVLGRGLRSPAYASMASAGGSLWILAGILFSFYRLLNSFELKGLLKSPENQLFGTGQGLQNPALSILISVLGGLALLWACHAALSHRALRHALPVALPLVVIFVAGLPAAFWLFNPPAGQAYIILGQLSLAIQFAVSIFLPFSGWIPGILPKLYSEIPQFSFPMFEWWRLPLALAVQLLVIVALLRLAARSVELLGSEDEP
jgi:hypothetical protein